MMLPVALLVAAPASRLPPACSPPLPPRTQSKASGSLKTGEQPPGWPHTHTAPPAPLPVPPPPQSKASSSLKADELLDLLKADISLDDVPQSGEPDETVRRAARAALSALVGGDAWGAPGPPAVPARCAAAAPAASCTPPAPPNRRTRTCTPARPRPQTLDRILDRSHLVGNKERPYPESGVG